jgi:hypothetical protein
MEGESLGNYRLVMKLGEGGMGVVYLAEHKLLPRRAAIKVLRPELSHSPEALERFMTEARSNALVRHPSVVDVIDCGRDENGQVYIVTEYLEGCALADRLAREGRLPIGEAAAIARQVASAVGAAHASGIVHRDLKPENVFLCSGPPPRVKILDFGIAKLIDPPPDSGRVTRTGMTVGTPRYMSPEQCRGVGSVDHRSDIYSLGCILFEMICGRPPFTHEGSGELIAAHLGEPPPRPLVFRADVPPAMERLIGWMLAKHPEDRPGDMAEVVAALDDGPEPFSTSTPAPATGTMRLPSAERLVARPPTWTQRAMRGWYLSLPAVLLVLAAALAFLLRGGASPSAPELPIGELRSQLVQRAALMMAVSDPDGAPGPFTTALAAYDQALQRWHARPSEPGASIDWIPFDAAAIALSHRADQHRRSLERPREPGRWGEAPVRHPRDRTLPALRQAYDAFTRTLPAEPVLKGGP